MFRGGLCFRMACVSGWPVSQDGCVSGCDSERLCFRTAVFQDGCFRTAVSGRLCFRNMFQDCLCFRTACVSGRPVFQDGLCFRTAVFQDGLCFRTAVFQDGCVSGRLCFRTAVFQDGCVSGRPVFQDGCEHVIETLSLIDAVMPEVVESRKQAVSTKLQPLKAVTTPAPAPAAAAAAPSATNGDETAAAAATHGQSRWVHNGIQPAYSHIEHVLKLF